MFSRIFRKVFNKHNRGSALTYDDVNLIPKLNPHGSRKNVSIQQTDSSGKLTLEVPIISANMDKITGHKMADFMASSGAMGAIHRLMSIDENVVEFEKCQNRAFVSIGCNEKGLRRAEALYQAGARYFNLDIAHGHSSDMKYTLSELRKRYKDLFIMSGNVATLSGAQYLYDHGSDMVKVGIGGGSVCTTRIKTGFGVPNLTAIAECSQVKCSIVADGGIRTPGDVVKALAFGADFVMIGGLLAGTEQTPGEVIESNGKEFKIYRGLDSFDTHMDWFGEVSNWKTPEGVSVKKPFAGSAKPIIDDLVGGIRSGLTYCGASTITELQKNYSYHIVSAASTQEAYPHATKLR
jgi:IMP dehydrogenase